MAIGFDIGARLKQLRQEHSMSQEQLAILANVTTTYYGEVERNLKRITVSKLESICDVLNISLSDFFSSDHVRMEPSDDPTMDAILRVVEPMSTDEKQAILRLVREAVSFRNLEHK